MKVSFRTALAIALGWSVVTGQAYAQGTGQPYANGYGSGYSTQAQAPRYPAPAYNQAAGVPGARVAPQYPAQQPVQYQAQAPAYGQRYPLQQPGLQAPVYPAAYGYRQDDIAPTPDPNVAPQLPPQASPSDLPGQPIELVPLEQYQQPMGSGYQAAPTQPMYAQPHAAPQQGMPQHGMMPQADVYHGAYGDGGYMAQDSYPSTGCNGCYDQAMSGNWQGTVWDDSYAASCGATGAAAPRGGVWFGGAYGLLMQRRYESPVYLSIDPGMPSVSNLSSTDANLGTMGGMEVAFGRQMCNGWAWQVSYWGLFQENAQVRVNNMPDTMLSGLSMLTYDPMGYAADTVQNYYNAADSHEIVRSNEFHNVELNFIRYNIAFPSFGAGIGSGVGAGLVGGGRGACGVGGCGTGACGTGSCGTGACGLDACSSGCGPTSSWSGSMFAGARFFKFDEFFSYRSTINGLYNYDVRDMFYDIDLENNLVGFQLGGNVNYALGCRWNVFAGTKLGIYNNHITHYSRIYGVSGNAMVNSGAYAGEDYAIRSSTNNFSFLSEFNLGLGYQISPCWRAVGGYRLMGATGIALAPNQIPHSFSYLPGVGKINDDGSLLLHGAFVGLEFAR